MGELRGKFWEVNVIKWKKITTFSGERRSGIIYYGEYSMEVGGN